MRICITEGCYNKASKPFTFPERCITCDDAISIKKMQELAAIREGLAYEGSIKDVGEGVA